MRAPAGWRDKHQESDHRCNHEADSNAREAAAIVLGIKKPKEAGNDEAGHHQRHALCGRGHYGAQRRADPQASAWMLTHADQTPHTRKHEDENDVVMVERAWCEFFGGWECERGNNGCSPLSFALQSICVAELAAQADGKKHEGPEQAEWPDEGGGDFGVRLPHDRREECNGRSEECIDPLRPMHWRAVRRVEAVLDVVEPALPSEHVTDAHQAHGVIGLGKILVDRSHARAGNQDDCCNRPA